MSDEISSRFDLHLDGLRPYIQPTPIIESEPLNALAGCRMWFKCENWQPIGAFKIRGALHAGLSLKDSGLPVNMATHSSGNHGQAVAYAASRLRGKAFVVMPDNAPRVKVEGVEFYGGQVTFCRPGQASREEALSKILAETRATPVHPYNDTAVIEGQGTCAWEMLTQLEHCPDMLLVPVGGGGLLSGTLLACNMWSREIRVIGTEPAGADDATRSFRSGKRVTELHPDTIADGLLMQLGEIPFRIMMEHAEDMITVTETEIINAIRLIVKYLKIVPEPSAAVPLAAVMANRKRFTGKALGIILSGGNVDPEGLGQLLLS